MAYEMLGYQIQIQRYGKQIPLLGTRPAEREGMTLSKW